MDEFPNEGITNQLGDRLCHIGKAAERSQEIDSLVFAMVQAHEEGDERAIGSLTIALLQFGVKVDFGEGYMDIIYLKQGEQA